MKNLILIILVLSLFSCDKVKTEKTIKSDKKSTIKASYSTKFCSKNKKLWAKSFLGKPAPEFTVEGWINNKKPDMKGKFILIDFWGLYCPQCKKAIPELNKIHEKYKNKLVVVGIATGSEDKIKKGHYPKIEYYSAYDRKSRLKAKYQVRGIPHVVIIAPDNTVVWEGYPFLGSDRLTIDKVGKIINQ